MRSGGGGGSHSSEVRYLRDVEKVGGPARSCSYYVERSDCLQNDSLFSPEGCAYYVRNAISNSERKRLKLEFSRGVGLWARKNRFYVPDSAGGWEEVRL